MLDYDQRLLKLVIMIKYKNNLKKKVFESFYLFQIKMPKSLVLILLCYVFNQQLKSAFTRHSIYFVIVKLFFIVKFKQNLIKPYLNSHINIYWKNKKAFKEKAREQRKITVITVLLYYTLLKKKLRYTKKLPQSFFV